MQLISRKGKVWVSDTHVLNGLRKKRDEQSEGFIFIKLAVSGNF